MATRSPAISPSPRRSVGSQRQDRDSQPDAQVFAVTVAASNGIALPSSGIVPNATGYKVSVDALRGGVSDVPLTGAPPCPVVTRGCLSLPCCNTRMPPESRPLLQASIPSVHFHQSLSRFPTRLPQRRFRFSSRSSPARQSPLAMSFRSRFQASRAPQSQPWRICPPIQRTSISLVLGIHQLPSWFLSPTSPAPGTQASR